MERSRNYLIFAAAVAVITVILASGGSVHTSAQSSKKSDPAALRPFQQALCLDNGISGCGDLDSEFNAPVTTSDGEPVLRLVIEYVSGRCIMSSGGINTQMGLRTVAGGTTVNHTFVPVVAVPGAETNVAQATRIYVDPGSQAQFGAGVQSSPASQCRMSISGHLAVE